MRRVWAVLLACMLALAAGACSSVEGRYYREGIGTELYWSGLPEATRLEDLYFGYICQQAGLPVVVEGDYVLCATGFGQTDWALFVQAGLNDIDRRCDAYLTWLDHKRRWSGAIHQQILHTESATDLILAATNPSPKAIAIVAAAFGLAANTYTNFSSRLLLEVNQSTVQEIVFRRQTVFRTDIRQKSVVSRPDAIHALRLYLRICMPITIETEINTGITLQERTGLISAPLVTPRTVGAPLKARMEVVKPERPINSDPIHATIIQGWNENIHSVGNVNNVLRRLCTPTSELRSMPKARARILAYQQYRHDTRDITTKVTGVLSPREMDLIANAPTCPTDKFRNYYEREAFPSGINDPDLITKMNKQLASDRQLSPTATVQQVRARIPEVRNALKAKQATLLEDKELADQITNDLVNELIK